MENISGKNPAELDRWTRQGAYLFSTMLLAGFCVPLLKPSMLFGSSVIMWPWQIMGFGLHEPATVAAAATVSNGKSILWGLLPLVSGGITLINARQHNLTLRLVCMLATGAAMLVLLMVIYIREAEILGLIFVPPTAAGGFLMLIVIVAGALIASANHLGKTYENNTFIKLLSGIGGFFLAALLSIQLVAAGNAWRNWSMIMLYAAMIFFGLSGIKASLKGVFSDSHTSFMSFTLRAILVWAPVACLIAQKWSSDDFGTYVIGAGGGLPHIVSSVLKCFLIYYGSAFLMGMGLCALIELRLMNKGRISYEFS